MKLTEKQVNEKDKRFSLAYGDFLDDGKVAADFVLYANADTLELEVKIGDKSYVISYDAIVEEAFDLFKKEVVDGND